MIAIVDYGMGNLASIKNMLKRIGVDAEITSSCDVLEAASRIILPGVGAFDNAMLNMESLGIVETLTKKALVEKVPILGICLGMQILLESSEEGGRAGLGWIEGRVRKFVFEKGPTQLKVPHMGWNLVNPNSGDSFLFKGLISPRFYFVHGYYVECKNAGEVLATTNYGSEFHSAVHRDNIFGTQFHPEKSHKFGMQLLKNFVEIPK